MADRHTTGADAGSTTGIVLLLFTVFVWGAQFPIAKSTFEHVDPFHAAIVRYGLPVLILVGLLVWREGLQSMRFDARAGQATLFGLIGMFGSPSLVFGGLQFARPEIAAIIVAVQPALTAVVLWLWRGKRPATVSLICIAVAFFGVLTVVTRWSLSLAPSGSELVGDLMIFAGACCWVIYTISGERFQDWSILRLTALTMLPGMIGHMVLTSTLVLTGVVTMPAWSEWYEARYGLLYLSLVGVLLSMLTWNAGTKRMGPLNAMLFLNLIPVVTFGVRYWQGYRFAAIELVGAALVIAALVANNLWLRAQSGARPWLRRRLDVRRKRDSNEPGAEHVSVGGSGAAVAAPAGHGGPARRNPGRGRRKVPAAITTCPARARTGRRDPSRSLLAEVVRRGRV
ncbi:MAG: DMT family transporter [Burkholderiaceae bacterium]